MSKTKRVIPGFRITMGFSLVYLGLIVLIPLAALVLKGSGMGIEKFFSTVFETRVMRGYGVSFLCAFIAAVINSIFGIALAWILVRYKFPFKRILDGLVLLHHCIRKMDGSENIFILWV